MKDKRNTMKKIKHQLNINSVSTALKKDVNKKHEKKK